MIDIHNAITIYTTEYILFLLLNITIRPIKSSWIYRIFVTSSWLSQHFLLGTE